jgi:hypothetical protein
MMVVADIPHCLVHFHEYSAIKPRIRFSEELKQTLMYFSEIYHQGGPLPRDEEHMNPNKVMEHPACCRVLYRLPFWLGNVASWSLRA